MNVALVSMPFGPIFSPSIALGLLKSITIEHGSYQKTYYFNLKFAKLVGERFYHNIASGLFPTHLLIGEWIFSTCLDNAVAEKDQDFLEEIVKPLFPLGEYHTHDQSIGYSQFIKQLLEARRIADAFVDDCVESILIHAPNLIGITSVFQQHVASLTLAKRIKMRAPQVFVVLRGANCEGTMGRALLSSAPWVDAIVSGEGESIFAHLLNQLKEQKQITS
jgi:hypothetical protein